MGAYNKYAALADTIKIEEITKDSINRDILHKLEQNEQHSISLVAGERPDCNDEDEWYDHYYIPKDGDDIGWLGYYIGQNTKLREINFLTIIDNESFYNEISRNKSIQVLHYYECNISNGRLFSMLDQFFKNNHGLCEIDVSECTLNPDSIRQLALAIRNCGKSIKCFTFSGNEIGDSSLVIDIITALSMHPQLTTLDLTGKNMGRDECTALSTLLRYTTSRLEKMILYNNVDDEGVEELINVLVNINTLEEMNIASNSITTRGWKAVANLLEMPNSNLEIMNVASNNIGDAGAQVFATALASNSTLKRLDLYGNGITPEGWAHFSKLLCDASSVNNTYLSNHTLQSICRNREVPGEVLQCLILNGNDDKQQVTMSKILERHSHFNMEPFFEWEFKVLPIMIEWFTNATRCVTTYDQKISRLRLSATFDFIKEFPMLYIEPVTRKEIAGYTTIEEQLQGKPMWQEKLGEIRECKARSMRRLGMK